MTPAMDGNPEPRAKRPKKTKMPPISNFQLPPLDFLSPPPPYDHEVQEEALLAQARKLENTLMHFGVEGKVVAIRPGPVITMIEFEPALGVKISKVTGLADDLALALKAMSIRIVAPVPGKAVIGIEVPNLKRQLVTLREVLSHEVYHKVRLPSDHRPGKRYYRPIRDDRSGQNAPSAHRRGHRHRQERRAQRHDRQHPL